MTPERRATIEHDLIHGPDNSINEVVFKHRIEDRDDEARRWFLGYVDGLRMNNEMTAVATLILNIARNRGWKIEPVLGKDTR